MIALNAGPELRAKPEEDKTWRTDVLFGYGKPSYLIGAGFGRISRGVIPFSKLKDADATSLLDTLVQARGVLQGTLIADVDLVSLIRTITGKYEPRVNPVLQSFYAPRDSGVGITGRLELSALALPAKDNEKSEFDTEFNVYVGLFGAKQGFMASGYVGYGLAKNPYLDRGFDSTSRLKLRADARTPYGKVVKSLHVNAFGILQEDLPLAKSTLQLDDGTTTEKWPTREVVVYLGVGIDIAALFEPSKAKEPEKSGEDKKGTEGSPKKEPK